MENALNWALARRLLAPLTGLEPVHTAPEADALSAELQGLERVRLPDRSMAPPADTGGA